MSSKDVKVGIREASEKLTLRIKLTGMRRWTLRWRIAVALIWLGARVAPVEAQVDVNGRSR